MRCFGENLSDGNERRERERERERRQRDRDEGEFIGPNPPGGRRTKNKSKRGNSGLKTSFQNLSKLYQKYTSNERSNQFIDLRVQNGINCNSP